MSDFIDHISTLFHTRRFPEALSALSAAVKEDPVNWNYHYLLGFAYRSLGDYDSAIAAYSEAAELAPSEAPIFVNLGVAHQHAGDYQSAIGALERAIALNPHSANAYNSLGYTHKLAGQYDDAIIAYDSGFEAHAALIYSTLNNLRSSRIYKHQDVLVEVWMEKVIKVAVNAAVREGLDSIALPDGKTAELEEQAEEHEGLYYIDMTTEGKHLRLLLPNYFNTFRECLRGDMLTAILLNNIGCAFQELGNHTTARARFIESIQFTPPDTDYPSPYDGLQQCEAE